jgi:prepilin peptidase CpaA
MLVAGATVLVICALHDAAFRTVPNAFAASLAIFGLAARAMAGDLATTSITALIVFAAAALCWRRGWMGGGDVKLLAAAACFVPPAQVPLMLACIAMTGGALALPYLIGRRFVPRPALSRPAALPARLLRAEHWRLSRGGPLPYAVAIAAGAGIALIRGGVS